jgi:hypothetical protein
MWEIAMRAFVFAVLTVAGFAAVPGVASAADIPVTEGCAPGSVWDGYNCVVPQQRYSQAQPQYAQPQYAQPQYNDPQYSDPQYAEPQEDVDQGYDAAPVYRAAPVYVAPPVYVGRPYYAPRPVYIAPRRVVRVYAGPHYGWGPRPWRHHW